MFGHFFSFISIPVHYQPVVGPRKLAASFDNTGSVTNVPETHLSSETHSERRRIRHSQMTISPLPKGKHYKKMI